MNRQQFTMQQAVQMIEAFKGLPEVDVRRILGICRAKNYPRDHKVYSKDDPSDEMIILLKGQMIVTTELGAVVGSSGEWHDGRRDGILHRATQGCKRHHFG